MYLNNNNIYDAIHFNNYMLYGQILYRRETPYVNEKRNFWQTPTGALETMPMRSSWNGKSLAPINWDLVRPKAAPGHSNLNGPGKILTGPVSQEYPVTGWWPKSGRES